MSRQKAGQSASATDKNKEKKESKKSDAHKLPDEALEPVSGGTVLSVSGIEIEHTVCGLRGDHMA